MIIKDWHDTVLKNAGLTRGETSWNDRELIFQPIRSPDTFTDSGSLSFSEAKKRWVKKLKGKGFNSKSISKDVFILQNGKINTHPWALIKEVKNNDSHSK